MKRCAHERMWNEHNTNLHHCSSCGAIFRVKVGGQKVRLYKRFGQFVESKNR